MNNDQEKYTDPNDHLSETQLMRYSKEKMNDVETHRVEMHLLSCDLCQDALDGIEILKMKGVNSSIKELKVRLSRRIGKRKRKDASPLWKWAAVAAIVLLSSVSIIFILDTANKPNNKIVKKETSKEKNLPYLSGKPLEKLETDTPTLQNATFNGKGISLNDDLKNNDSNKKRIAPEEREAKSVQPLPSSTMAPSLISDEIKEDMSEPMVFDGEAQEKFGEESKNKTMESDSMSDDKALAHISSDELPKLSVDITRQRLVSGTITDDIGEPLPGVNIILKGSSIGTISDINGEYLLTVPNLDTAIQIRSIGYSSEEILVKDTTSTITTILKPDVMALSEVVVSGYGTQKKMEVQSSRSTTSENKTIPPKPLKGNKIFYRYLKDSLFTVEAIKEEVEGNIKLSFFVEKDSTLSNFNIIDPIGYGLDKEAIRLIKEGPKWIPGKSEDGSLRQQVILQVPIKLKKKK